MPAGVLCTCIVGGAAELASRRAPSGRPRSSERETRAVRISHKADYGVRAVVALARALGDEPGTPVPRERLSPAESIPGKFLDDFLRSLRNGGIVRRHRDPEGVWTLARRPDRTTVAASSRATGGGQGG